MLLTHKCAAPLGAAGALVAAIAVVLLAGCGGSSPSAGLAHLPSTGTSTGPGAASPGSGSPQAAELAFAACMRANGLPSFPDPSAGGGFQIRAGSGPDPSSPAFKAAQAKCKKLLPGGGPPGPGTSTHPSSQVLAKFVAAAQCMRQHGVYDFPDPRTSVPSNPFGSGRGVISDIEGVIFIFPQTIDMSSQQFTRAAGACAFPLHNH